MNTTAQQLRLAADILETGHPWEYHDRQRWTKPLQGEEPLWLIQQGMNIRPVLDTPPDGRPLHNPDNLTAEQVWVGHRLAVKGESMKPRKADIWIEDGWQELLVPAIADAATFRLPLSVPWPPAPVDPYAELKAAHAAGKVIQAINVEGDWKDIDYPPMWNLAVGRYRIKPDATPFQLPPHPPGMQWHREDGWKPEDLPPGTRPLVYGEERQSGDEVFNNRKWLPVEEEAKEWPSYPNAGMDVTVSRGSFPSRTTRPLVFTHAGKQWTWHRPGDPMPCDGEREVHVFWVSDEQEDTSEVKDAAKEFDWTKEPARESQIIGWRYAEPATKEVELGPEDVPPESVLRRSAGNQHFHADEPWEWAAVVNVDKQHGCMVTGFRAGGLPFLCVFSWASMKEGCEINRPRHRDADGNPTLWEPCHKTITTP